MWMMPLHLHVNQKSDYDYDMMSISPILQLTFHECLMLDLFLWGHSSSDCDISYTHDAEQKPSLCLVFSCLIKSLINPLYTGNP